MSVFGSEGPAGTDGPSLAQRALTQLRDFLDVGQAQMGGGVHGANNGIVNPMRRGLPPKPPEPGQADNGTAKDPQHPQVPQGPHGQQDPQHAHGEHGQAAVVGGHGEAPVAGDGTLNGFGSQPSVAAMDGANSFPNANTDKSWHTPLHGSTSNPAPNVRIEEPPVSPRTAHERAVAAHAEAVRKRQAQEADRHKKERKDKLIRYIVLIVCLVLILLAMIGMSAISRVAIGKWWQGAPDPADNKITHLPLLPHTHTI